MDDFLLELIDFYTPYFHSPDDAIHFIEECRNHTSTLRCCHQIYRLIGKTSQTDSYPFNSDCIQIFFWAVCIESLHDRIGIKNVGKAQMVRDFFTYYVNDTDKEYLANNLRYSFNGEPVDVATLIIDIRNQFAHEGTYWMFSLNSESEPDSMIVAGPNEESYEVNITARQMRDIIVRGTIQFLQQKLSQFHCG